MTWRIVQGDARERLRELPGQSVHCVVTSPPYFGLRKYLDDDHEHRPQMIGLESSWPEHLAALLDVFREVRRVLRDDGLLFVNYGDAYDDNRKMGMPWRFAFAMQDDGWILRGEVIWHKKSPMPESVDGTRWERCRIKVVDGQRAGGGHRTMLENGSNNLGPKEREATDAQWSPCPGCPKCIPHGGLVLRRGAWRCTTAHEYVFQFSKSARYFADAGAVRTKSAEGSKIRRGPIYSIPASAIGIKKKTGNMADDAVWMTPPESNLRSVWSLSSEPSSEKHYAAFPTKLVTPCVKVSTSAKGCCPKCGACWARVVEKGKPPDEYTPGYSPAFSVRRFASNTGNYSRPSEQLGWLPTCDCNAGEPVPCSVLDPFAGSGTVGVVCRHMGLDFIGIELNQEYVAIAERRIGEALAGPELEAIPDATGQQELFT